MSSTRLVPLLLSAIVLAGGCAPAKQDDPTASDPVASQDAGGGGVTPISPGAGAMSPVVGAETVEGSGAGGVGSAAKGKAREIAGQSPSSLNQMADEGQ